MLDLTQIPFFLASYQYLVIFITATIEGPLTTIAAGFLAAQNIVNFYLIYLLIILSDLLGDILYYALGRWGGHWGLKLFRINKQKFTRLKHHFNKNNGKAIVIGKITQGLGGVIIFIAGVVHMPLKKFLILNTLMTIPKSLVLLLIGYFFGASYARISHYFDYYAWATLILAIILLSIYLIIIKKIKEKNDL